MFQLTIKTDNAAFHEDGREAVDDTAARDAEVARILRLIANAIENGRHDGAAMDVNGNRVGSYSFD